MFIGQAPGSEEDQDGVGFVGPTSRLLQDAIDEYGVSKFPYRFEYVVKCYPPNDKRPTKKQMEACLDSMLDAIVKYEPELIVPLGGVALLALTGIKKISDLMGTVFDSMVRNNSTEKEKKTWRIFPMLHPAAVLRDERKLGSFISQMLTLERFLNKKRSRVRTKPSYDIIEDAFIAGLDIDELETDEPMAIDFETCGGFDPRAKDTHIRCLGFSRKPNQAVCLVYESDKMKPVLKTFLSKNIPFIAHNAKYEMKWAIEKFGIEPNIVDDTAILAHLVNENYNVSLECVGPLYSSITNYKGQFHYFMSQGKYDWATVPIDELAQYNCSDCDTTLRIRNKLLGIVEEKKMIRLYREIEIPMMKSLARIELRGMHIDKRVANSVIGTGKIRMTQIRKQIEKQPEVERGMRNAGIEELNLGSQQQVTQLFYKWWRVNTSSVRKTKSEAYSTDKYTIDNLAKTYPKVKLVKEYRGISHGISDIETILEKASGNLISCDYTQTYVVTGRLSSRNPNLQNLPNPKEIEDTDEITRKFGDAVKKIFVSRFGQNGGILNADYSQLELRLVANESGDPTYIDALNTGKDLHTITAKSLPGVDPEHITKEQRFIGKRLNFAVVYGAGPGELAKNFRKPKSECKEYLEAYGMTYPFVLQYMEDLHDYAREHGYVVSKFGRRRHLPEINSEDYWTAKRAMNQAGNFPIASMGADLTKWATAKVDQELVSRGFKSMVIGQVHDSIIIDYHKREKHRLAKIIEEIMVKEAMEKWPFFEKVPLKIDISVGPNWLEQEDL